MRAIVTVVGKDKSGIIAKISSVLADNDVNIEDISQTIVSGNFTMIMLCSLSGSNLSLAELKAILCKAGDEAGVSVHVQSEDIFNAMHNV